MSTLQERQEQRKERLMQLKAIAAESGGQGEKSLKRGNDGEHSSLRFRSYQPESTELQGFIQQAPAVGPAANESGVDTVESRVKKIHENVLEEERTKNPELDLTKLAPKKPNWDLKRDLEKKLEKLERKTQIAIGDLIRERLKGSKDIAAAVNVSNTIEDNYED